MTPAIIESDTISRERFVAELARGFACTVAIELESSYRMRRLTFRHARSHAGTIRAITNAPSDYEMSLTVGGQPIGIVPIDSKSNCANVELPIGAVIPFLRKVLIPVFATA
jgi:hypothetical protein